MRIDLDELPPEAIRELAQSYLDLLELMTSALEVCHTGWAFYRWNGVGYEITGHPPDELVEAIKAKVE